MSKYVTRQRRVLLAYLREHTDEALSANQILDALKAENISQSAIYRNLAVLEQEGQLKRSAKPGNPEVYYRYTDVEHCQDHLHLSCLRCGKTVHMEQNEADRLAESIAKNEGFTLARADTVLYGICPACRK